MTVSLPLRRIYARDGLELGAAIHSWPYTLPVARAALAGLEFGQLTIIMGENGAGKSSLIESIAEAFGLPLDGGPASVQRGSVERKSAFGDALQVVRGAAHNRRGIFFRAETMHTYASYLLGVQSDYGYKLLRKSHGEGTQLLLDNAHEKYGLWILDEPESGLSFAGQLELAARLLVFLDMGGQIILCTHSPLLASIATRTNTLIWEIGQWGIGESVWSTLDEVKHWRTMLDDPESYLRHLL